MAETRKPMSEDHKEALSIGRNQGRIVRGYLEGLEAVKPRRGRKRTRDTIAKRLDAVEAELSHSKALQKLELIQERIDLRAELENFDPAVDIRALEESFIEVGKAYASRRGISYAAFREMGVEAGVLKRAGITRSQTK
jgi:predicted DNA binding CopG/RHH family protein